MLGEAGVTPIAFSVADVTVSVVLPKMFPNVALMTAEPAARDVASPVEPAVLLIAATAVSDELQVTDAVRSRVVLSE